MRVSDTIWKHEMKWDFVFDEFDLNEKTPRKNIRIYTEIQDQNHKKKSKHMDVFGKKFIILMSNQA